MPNIWLTFGTEKLEKVVKESAQISKVRSLSVKGREVPIWLSIVNFEIHRASWNILKRERFCRGIMKQTAENGNSDGSSRTFLEPELYDDFAAGSRFSSSVRQFDWEITC